MIATPHTFEARDRAAAVARLAVKDAGPLPDASSALQMLLPALQRLDHILGQAVANMQSGEPNAAPALRGLYIDEEEVVKLLARAPLQSSFEQSSVPVDQVASLADEAPLGKIIKAFALSAFDVDLVILALAPELDLRYERLYGFLQDDITRKHPSVELAVNLFCATAEEKVQRRAHFDSSSPLIQHGILHLLADPNQVSPPLLAHYLKLDGQIVRFLLGHSGLEPRLSAFCEFIEAGQNSEKLPLVDELAAVLHILTKPDENQSLRLYFQGAPDAGKRKATRVLANASGLSLLVCDVGRILEASDFDARLNCVFREANLRGSLLYLCGADVLRADNRSHQRDALQKKVAGHPGAIILAGNQPWTARSTGFAVQTIRFGVLDLEQRRAEWETRLRRIGAQVQDHELDALASRFRLTTTQIEAAVLDAQHGLRWRPGRSLVTADASSLKLEDLYAAARAECGHQLASLARRIEPRHGWDDIVLPPDQVGQLREICFQVAYRHVVYNAWGFDRKLTLGKGLNILFFGAPGTGKTMAAEVIAYELRLDLYRIDLSQVISKYIGETEKNLDRIFEAAENSNAILFFDEADALFGKRSEVRDSHDRYANIEISYLLQKMEEYQGVSVLATNLRQNLDDAFVRRLQVIVEFPFPDEEYRHRIWRKAFPSEAPLGDDVRFERLARDVRLAGGNIKNMALSAAFLAAADGHTIHMSHLAQAARREHQKLGRTWNDAAFREYATRAQ